MNRGKELSIKQVLARQGKKVIVTYSYRQDLVMTVEGSMLVDEKGKYTISNNDSDVVFYEYLE